MKDLKERIEILELIVVKLIDAQAKTKEAIELMIENHKLKKQQDDLILKNQKRIENLINKLTLKVGV